MFKPTNVCLSVLSKRTKRVNVQLMRDFPAFQLFKGQVTKVKPSLMTNYLHRWNGARYILKETDIDQELLQFSETQRTNRIQEKKLEQERELLAIKNMKLEQEEKTKMKQQHMKEVKKEIERVLNTNVSLKDVKIPGLDI